MPQVDDKFPECQSARVGRFGVGSMQYLSQTPQQFAILRQMPLDKQMGLIEMN
jgi:hypothetical protein